jgi:hemerythrin
MTRSLPWDPAYPMGHATLDAQHRQILGHCDALLEAGPEPDTDFDGRFKALMALAEEHFATEVAVLTQAGYPALDEHRDEQEEFRDLVNDIITPGRFNPEELQRFMGLWWIGHIVGSGKKIRAFLEPQTP